MKKYVATITAVKDQFRYVIDHNLNTEDIVFQVFAGTDLVDSISAVIWQHGANQLVIDFHRRTDLTYFAKHPLKVVIIG